MNLNLRQLLHEITAPMPNEKKDGIIIYGDECIHPGHPMYDYFKKSQK